MAEYVAEYCCPVWARSTHRKLVNTTLNETCRLITGCIRPTATPDLYVLSGIAPPEIRRSVHSQNKCTKQLTNQRHSLHHHQPVNSRLHSHNSFITISQPLLCKPAKACVAKWQEHCEETDSNLKRYNIHPKERHPSGLTLPWRTANQVRSREAATPAAKHLWGYQESKLFVRCSHMRSQPHYDELHTCRGETEQRRHCENGGSVCAVTEWCCRHDMMNHYEICKLTVLAETWISFNDT